MSLGIWFYVSRRVSGFCFVSLGYIHTLDDETESAQRDLVIPLAVILKCARNTSLACWRPSMKDRDC